ncbi:MAG: SpoIIE family protein phosphatase [Treponema sp.]|jgi:serine phosphatase RsbU (regulator of sigma subunit)|nr:SpoIIE family protein phosphatase [Treponema sp.]
MKKKLRPFGTIRMKLLVPIICAVIAGALMMAYIGSRITSRAIISAAITDGNNAAQSLCEYIDLVLSTAQLDLSAVVLHPSVKPVALGQIPPGGLEEYMAALIKRYPIYNNILVLNKSGIVVAGTSGSNGSNNSDREYFKAGMRGENYISEVEVSRSTGRLVSFISVPVFDEGKVIGVIMAGVLIHEINRRYVAPVKLLGGSGYAMIVNSAGTILGHKNESLLGEKIPENLLERIITLGEERVAFEDTVDGVPSMLFVKRDNITDWFPIVIVSVSDFYTSSNFVRRAIIALAAGVILLLTVIVLFAVNGVTRALSAAIRYAETVSQGGLEAELSVRRKDEVGVLAQSLRDMVASLKQMIAVATQKTREAQEATETLIQGINYASKIQRDLLPRNYAFDKAFRDYFIIWKPRDIVGGDIFWLKNFEQGTILCVCDCTGHGTSGAMLTMLVVSALESCIWPNNCHDTAGIIWQIEQKLVSNFSVNADERNLAEIQDGCDLAVLFIARDGSVSISSGHIPVFVCDGKEVRQIKGQRIAVGEGRLKSKDEINVVRVEANQDNTFYIGSDGLFDQPGGPLSIPFGYKTFKRIILENHDEKLSVISDKVWKKFEEYRGDEMRVDDIQLLSFKP